MFSIDFYYLLNPKKYGKKKNIFPIDSKFLDALNILCFRKYEKPFIKLNIPALKCHQSKKISIKLKK
jgi:hypothetical protein